MDGNCTARQFLSHTQSYGSTWSSLFPVISLYLLLPIYLIFVNPNKNHNPTISTNQPITIYFLTHRDMASGNLYKFPKQLAIHQSNKKKIDSKKKKKKKKQKLKKTKRSKKQNLFTLALCFTYTFPAVLFASPTPSPPCSSLHLCLPHCHHCLLYHLVGNFTLLLFAFDVGLLSLSKSQTQKIPKLPFQSILQITHKTH